MSLGIIELLVLAALVVLIVRGAGNGHLLYWLAATAAILLVVGLGLTVMYSFERRAAAERHAIEVQRERAALQAELAQDLAERRARGEVIPDMYGELGRGDQPVSHEYVSASVSKVGVLVLLLLPLGAFAAVRAHRHGGAAPWLAAGAAGLGLLMIGWIGVRSHVQTVAVVEPMPQFDATTTQPAEPIEPIDELWDRLNESQIDLEAEHDAATATLVAEVNAEAEGKAAVATTAAEVDVAAAPDGDAPVEEADAAAEDESAEVDASVPGADATQEAAPAVAADDHEAPAVDEPPPPRPEWVGTPRIYVNNVWRVPIEAGPYATLQECHAALEMEMRAVVETRIRDVVQERYGWSAYTPPLERMGLGTAFIYRELLADQYVESGEASFGPTKTAWALLEFDPTDDLNLLNAWQSYSRWDGIMITVVCSLGVLGVLALVYGLIKIDTWTRGYYSKRLFLGVPAAIIAMIVLFAMATA